MYCFYERVNRQVAYGKDGVVLLEYDERMERQVYASLNEFIMSCGGDYIGCFGKVENHINCFLDCWPYRARFVVKEKRDRYSSATVMMKISDKKYASKRQAGRFLAVSAPLIVLELPLS